MRVFSCMITKISIEGEDRFRVTERGISSKGERIGSRRTVSREDFIAELRSSGVMEETITAIVGSD